MNYPVYIPSLGRVDTATTPRLLDSFGIQYKLFVEKKEAAVYIAKYGKDKVVVLPGSDYGSVHVVRQAMKDHAAKAKAKFHWQVDDDIRKIFEHVGGKIIHSDARVIMEDIERFVDSYHNVGIAALASNNFIRGKKPPYQVNTSVFTYMLINTEVKMKYTPEVIDTDTALQHLYAGFCTVKFNKYVFNCPAMSSQPGGITGQRREQFLHNTLRRWPEIPGLKEKSKNKAGIKYILNVAAVWRKFKNNPALKPKK